MNITEINLIEELLNAYTEKFFPEGIDEHYTILEKKYKKYKKIGLYEMIEFTINEILSRSTCDSDYQLYELLQVIKYYQKKIDYRKKISVKSEKKTTAARINGAKGGRPKKDPCPCPKCNSINTIKNGKTKNNKQRYICNDCGRVFRK